MQRLIDLAKNTRKNGSSKEKALERLVRAGIFDKNGNYTKHYPTLASVFNKK